MAFKGKKISNPKFGQDITFLQTRQDTEGKLLEMESTYQPRSKEPIPHYHPFQSEDFIVLEGELTVKIDGEQKILKPGHHVYIPANVVHAMWNDSKTKTIVNWKVRPALQTEYLLETSCGLAMDNKTNNNGVPNLMQLAIMMNTFSQVFRLAKPPYFIQKILFGLIAPLAHAFGYRSTYSKYLD